MEKPVELIRIWDMDISWGDYVYVPPNLLPISAGAILLALVIGATTRTYFDVFARTLVLSLCLLEAQLLFWGLAGQYAERLMGNLGAIAESSARFLILLIWATIPWGVVRWVRWRRQTPRREVP